MINSVLISLYTYWAIIFLLPSSVLKKIIARCRNFLWDGNAPTPRNAPIAWDLICRNKPHGGLNVRDIKIYNLAAMGKYLWQVMMKEDNLWVKWVHGIYIREQDPWTYPPPHDASWSWRKLCKLRQNSSLTLKMVPG